MSKSAKAPDNKIIEQINKSPKVYATSITVPKLVGLIKYFSDIYYNTGDSVISDDAFDILVDVLKTRDPTNKYFRDIGAPVDKNAVPLPFPMGSLDKIKPEKDNLDAWLAKYPGPYILSDKLDGASGQLYIQPDGKPKLYSRGDGVEGQDITHLIPYIIPSTVDFTLIPKGTSIRGEIIISKDDFKAANADGEMKNARNTASGVINSKKINAKLAKICQFVAYNILHPEYKQSVQFTMLKAYGFNTAVSQRTDRLSFDFLSQLLKSRREASKFDVDGIVVFDDSKAYKVEPGNPPHGFAFKTVLDDQIAEAKIIRVVWEASKDGYLKPVIEIEPVELGGVTVRNATAFNGEFIYNNKLGPGAIIKIIRSGDVIPHIQEVITPAKEPQMPDEEYIWNASKKDIVTTNMDNDTTRAKLIVHFFKVLGVENIGEGVINKLVESGYKTVHQVVDAFMGSRTKLTKIEGFGEKSIEKIYNNMKLALETMDLTTLMAASNKFGRGFGTRRIKEIINAYPNIMHIQLSSKELIDKICEIDGFSDKTSTQFVENLHEFKLWFNKLAKIIDISGLAKEVKPEEKAETKPDQETKQEASQLASKIIVFTGFRDKDLEKQIEAKGGKVSTSVSSKTFIVVKPDGSIDTSGKISDAIAKNITIMEKSKFAQEYLG